ncbi:capsule biosynthesis protein [Bacillus velezensis]|uniref:YveK family protein n=1 Tax=Bacillus velezensis TaxID=492670 RepID=UPI001C94BE90|nr:Wzz/FepE/Etk N-terminal domain-containing protein [Bacillus velezensis]MBY6040053.1 capsule biosynthesis protein [Bacillus velezensis]MCA1238625.1 capsule biosynthesis protein [Bacillus velezensis]
MGESASIKEIFAILRKRLLFILIITAAASSAGSLISFFALTPVYENSTQILVSQSKNNQKEVQFNDVQTNLQLINTYNVIIKSPVILDEVIKQLHLSMTSKELESKITVSSEQDSQVVTIAVRDTDAKRAAVMANAVASVFQDKITAIMNVDNVSILSKAEASDSQSPAEPNRKLNIAIAFAAGLLGGIGLAFLLEHLDNTIKSEEQLEALLGIPILGTVTSISTKDSVAKSLRMAETKQAGGGHVDA